MPSAEFTVAGMGFSGRLTISSGRIMRNTLVVLFLLLGVGVRAAELTTAPDLKPPMAGDEKRVTEIREMSLAWWVKNRGLLAEESFKVAGHFSVARPIAGFAVRDDRVWEVRVLHMHTGGPTGILWINDKTEKVIALGVEEQEGTEAVVKRDGASDRR